MALCDKSVTGQAFLAEEVGAQVAVADVGMGAVAVDGGGVGQEDADVMEHGGFLDEIGVCPQLGVRPSYGEGLLRYLGAVEQKERFQRGIISVIFINQRDPEGFFFHEGLLYVLT